MAAHLVLMTMDNNDQLPIKCFTFSFASYFS